MASVEYVYDSTAVGAKKDPNESQEGRPEQPSTVFVLKLEDSLGVGIGWESRAVNGVDDQLHRHRVGGGDRTPLAGSRASPGRTGIPRPLPPSRSHRWMYLRI